MTIIHGWMKAAYSSDEFKTDTGCSLWIDISNGEWFFYNSDKQVFYVENHQSHIADLDGFLASIGKTTLLKSLYPYT